jgi:YfiH family protein
MEMIIQNPSTDDDETLADSGFYWRERDGVKMLVCRPLEDAGFANGFSTRLGGVSDFPKDSLNLAGFNEDSAENIYENRLQFLQLFDREYKLATVWQVHGDTVALVNSLEFESDPDDKADGLISDLHGILVAAKTADCVPVLLGDSKTRAFAAVHAGWRGTVQSIVEKAIAKMTEKFSTDPADLIAAIGPAAGKCNYEVGADVIEAFAANFVHSEKYFTQTREGHALVDLHSANLDQLVAAGVANENIYTAPFCTMERPDLFFSYRLEKQKFGKTGRLMSVIGRR